MAPSTNKSAKKGRKKGAKKSKKTTRLHLYPKFKVQGPSPPGIEMIDWNAAYNTRDTIPGRHRDREQARKDREAGITRAEAIKKLKEDKKLPDDFVDEWDGVLEEEEEEEEPRYVQVGRMLYRV
jgi:hypothetical protein